MKAGMSNRRSMKGENTPARPFSTAQQVKRAQMRKNAYNELRSALHEELPILLASGSPFSSDAQRDQRVLREVRNRGLLMRRADVFTTGRATKRMRKRASAGEKQTSVKSQVTNRKQKPASRQSREGNKEGKRQTLPRHSNSTPARESRAQLAWRGEV